MPHQVTFDRVRTLKFDIRATRDLETACGGRPLGLILGDITNFGITAISKALWVGLKHEDPTLTESLTLKLFDRYVTDHKSLRELIRALSDAMEETGLFQTDEPEPEAASPERSI
jgi:hypothetical protein